MLGESCLLHTRKAKAVLTFCTFTCCAFLHVYQFHGVLPLWALLQRVLGADSEHASASVAAIAQLQSLHTPTSKARAWVRQALVRSTLGSELEAVLSHKHLVAAFYEPGAVMRCADSSGVLQTMCTTLSNFSFELQIDHPSLNKEPVWPLLDDLDDADAAATADIRQQLSHHHVSFTKWCTFM
jgi:RUN domain